MQPRKNEHEPQADLFKVELRRLVDPKHGLVRLTNQINWQAFDEKFESFFAGEGRPAIETRLMVSLHYLKYLHDLSDEDTVAVWVENPYWQYISGRQYFEHSLPIDPSSMTRWRQRIGKEGAEELLRQTLETAMDEGYLKLSQCQRVSVDTTVQTKAIRFPTDARLYSRMRERLVAQAQAEGIQLRQSYRRIGVKVLQRQQNYAHAQQGRRAARQTKRLKIFLGRVVRDIERKAAEKSERMSGLLKLARRLMKQERDSKKKLYSIHEPQVECIAKGKAHQRYEFGNKVGFVVSGTGNWIVGAKSFVGNPFDGHTLKASICQAERMTGKKIQQATCDLGYRGHSLKRVKVLIVPRIKNKARRTIRRWWKRRNAIEPIIGHEKSDHRLERNRLAGMTGDSLNVLLAACGFNLKKLVRAFCAWLEKVKKRLEEVRVGYSREEYHILTT